MAAKELVEFVARSLVDDPEQVKVEVVREPDGIVLELHVAEDEPDDEPFRTQGRRSVTGSRARSTPRRERLSP